VNDFIQLLDPSSYALHEVDPGPDAGREDEPAESASSPACIEETDLRRASMKGERTERVRKKNWVVESLEKAWSAWVEEASGSSDEESGEVMEGPFG
jgi:hypothetical protein